MGNKMLIDATHAEETRVVVVRGNRIEEFDFESAARKQLKGNIYLAKVTRVEPSLQAAFIEYGGNRHGFLAFSEIHPDYYQIPVADRQALLREQEEADALAAAEEEAEDLADAEAQKHRPRRRSDPSSETSSVESNDGEETSDEDEDHEDLHDQAPDTLVNEVETHAELDVEPNETPNDTTESPTPLRSEALASSSRDFLAEELPPDEDRPHPLANDYPTPVDFAEDEPGHTHKQTDEQPEASESVAHPSSEHEVETVGDDGESHKVEQVGSGAEDVLEEVRQSRHQSRRPARRQYKIQEVIKRRQIILVQVVKEERGNKGAALTTYLSLAGRYCVLMPNTARGGGISRKITDAGDRRRLKEVARDVEVPQGMGLIVRTAGAQRTRPEIKRDFDYLMRLWENVRDLTLHSTAPALVYEEGSLIKRSIRDLYTKEVDEVFVEGDGAYREARDFMKMLMPSHAKNVKLYKDTRPLFAKSQVETQLDALYSPTITLPSGGYMVMNQTEALVAIDINSGKATREHNIEDTAYKTNLEACDEIARQLRLRDLAGLIVVDFIDMEENRNNRAVERRIKDALKNDRARIQVGRISHFGLLEMSRQRLRPGLLEASSRPCPHCEGRGVVRSVSSSALSVLRGIEDYLISRRAENITVKCSSEVAFYILNEKRDSLLAIENSFGISIFMVASDDISGSQLIIERAPDRLNTPRRVATLATPPVVTVEEDSDEIIEEETPGEELADEIMDSEARSDREASSDDPDQQRKRRRRGRRGTRRGERDGQPIKDKSTDETSDEQTSALDEDHPSRSERPSRNRHKDELSQSVTAPSEDSSLSPEGSDPTQAAASDDQASDASSEPANKDRPPRERVRRDRWGRIRKPREARPTREPQGEGDEPSSAPATHPADETGSTVQQATTSETPVRAEPAVIEVISQPVEPRKWQPPKPTVKDEDKPAPRSGWWSRRG